MTQPPSLFFFYMVRAPPRSTCPDTLFPYTPPFRSREPACLAAPDGNSALHDGLEASAEVLKLITFYSRNLAVPARRAVDDPQVLAGKRVFYESGCIACPRPKYATRRDPPGAEHSFQLTRAYSALPLPAPDRKRHVEGKSG